MRSIPIDAEKQVAYWSEDAKEDLDVADILMAKGKFMHALFFAHLAIEKALKAHVVKATNDMPPYIHNLTRLLRLTPLKPDANTEERIAAMNRYQIHGRYFNSRESPVGKEEADKQFAQAKEIYQWLTAQL